jgi:hypothetical protein
MTQYQYHLLAVQAIFHEEQAVELAAGLNPLERAPTVPPRGACTCVGHDVELPSLLDQHKPSDNGSMSGGFWHVPEQDTSCTKLLSQE